MNYEFDVVILGTGMAGSTIAHKCNSGGLKVAVIDTKPYGGTCALRGCDPKKVLYGATETLDWSNRMKNRGIATDKLRINWGDLMRFKETFVSEVPSNNEKRYKKAGISTFHGNPKFISPSKIKIDDMILSAKYIVLATGAKARDLGIEGQEYIVDNEVFLNLKELPKSIVFIGGGYISFEFGHIARSAGAHVSILHRSDKPLKNFESELIEKLVKHSRETGIEFYLNEEVLKVEKIDDSYKVYTSSGSIHEANLVVHGAGRSPNLDGLELQNSNVEFNNRGVIVNKFLQNTTNPIVYAAGDVAATNGLKLTPVAVSEGHVVASNILKGNKREVNNEGIPSVVFTIPTFATVGLTELQAKQRGFEYTIKMGETTNWYSVKRTNEKIAMYKVVIEKQSGIILGAHLLGSAADEVINLYAMAIQFKIPANRIKQMILAYPTHGSDIVYMV